MAPQDDYGMGWEGVREVDEHSGQCLLEQRLRGKKLPGALGDWLSGIRTKIGERGQTWEGTEMVVKPGG